MGRIAPRVRIPFWLFRICTIITLLTMSGAVGQAKAPGPDGALPGGFIENRGQVNDAILYYSPGGRLGVCFTMEAVVLELRIGDDNREDQAKQGAVVWFRFEGANPTVRIEARGEITTRYNYFTGDDPRAWRTDVPSYSEVVYRDLWPGIDLVYRLKEDGIAYSILPDPGADPEVVHFEIIGADRVREAGNGVSLIETAAGLIEEIRPAGVAGEGFLGLVSEESGPSPNADLGPGVGARSALNWCSFLGGYSNDAGGYSLLIDANHDAILIGRTASSNFPVTPGAYDPSLNGDYDVFAAKIDETGATLRWCTFLGGVGRDFGLAAVLDPEGNPIITGYTSSADFPTTPGAYDTSANGNKDAFLTKLSAAGKTLLWSTYLGGDRDDHGRTIAIDASGDVMVAGFTRSFSFPTTPGAYDRLYNGTQDAFVTKLSADGDQLLWGTFLGGEGEECVYGCTFNVLGQPVVTGYTSSADFPATAGSIDPTFNGDFDGFVTTLGIEGRSLIWSTYMGSEGFDVGRAVARTPAGDLFVTGDAGGAGFPTTPGVYDPSYNGDGDAFLANLGVNGADLLWSTFLGGSGYDGSFALSLDSVGDPVIGGLTYSADLPTTEDAFDRTYNGDADIILMKLDPAGGTLVSSTYVGGVYYDAVWAVACDPLDAVLAMGETWSPDFPTTEGAHDPSYNGLLDACALALRMPEAGAVPDPGVMGDTGLRIWPMIASRSIEIGLPRGAVPVGAIRVIDLAGRQVAAIPVDGRRATWDLKDRMGEDLRTGIYWLSPSSPTEAMRSVRIAIIR